jgi:hypothetical protein
MTTLLLSRETLRPVCSALIVISLAVMPWGPETVRFIWKHAKVVPDLPRDITESDDIADHCDDEDPCAG